MGSVLAKIVFKSGTETLPEPPINDVRRLDVLDIDGQLLKIGQLVTGKKIAIFVNVATK